MRSTLWSTSIGDIPFNLALTNNYAGAGAPVVGNDSTQGYQAGSTWVFGANVYICTSAAVRAAVWKPLESSGGQIVFSSADALTAHSGGGKISALALAAQINRFSTVAAALDSALLPASAPGGFVAVVNAGAHAAALYGAGSDTINDVVTTALFYLPVGATAVFYSTVASKWYGGLVGVAGAATQAQPTTPTAPSSTSIYAMQGLAGTISPARSGKVLAIISGDLIGSTTTAGDGVDVQISYGTGAAPANAAALTGMQAGGVMGYENPTTVTAADILVPFSTQALISSLTLGTAYWLDLAAKSVGTSSAVGLTNVNVTIVEL